MLELTCPVSSPLPGDAPLEPPVLGIVPGGRRSPGRSYKRQRSSRAGGKSQAEDEAEVGETPSSQQEAVHEVTPLGTPPTLPLVGVGRRTSVLFKKAKNGARLVRNKSPPQQNGKASEGKTNGLENSPASPSPPSVTNVMTLPPTPSASPAPPSPSSHHLRSRGPSSESEADKLPPPPGEGGKDKVDPFNVAREILKKSIFVSISLVSSARPDKWKEHLCRPPPRRRQTTKVSIREAMGPMQDTLKRFILNPT